MKDGHIHSHYCPHGSSDEFELYIKRALEVGLSEMTFTEHLPFPKNFEDPSPEKDSVMEEAKLLDYFEELSILKEKYKDKIKINIGVEVDYLEGYEEETTEMLNKYGNFIDDSILSVHIIKIDNEYCIVDLDPEEFENNINLLGSVEEVYNKYYNTLKLAINSDLGEYKPRRIGHFNLVRKFNKVYPYDYKTNNVLESVVKLVKDKNYELDFNVAGIRKEYCQEAYIHGHLLDLVKKYGVKTVFGSDSHSYETVGVFYSYVELLQNNK